jgi:hypothetical protein
VSAGILHSTRATPGTQHIRKVLAALAAKGTPQLVNDPMPPDLRACVTHLEQLGCPRTRAELAVAHSPWPAETIAEQIANWIRYSHSPAGNNMNRHKLAWLIAKRIEQAENCPPTPNNDPYAAYAGYLPFADNAPQAQETQDDQTE